MRCQTYLHVIWALRRLLHKYVCLDFKWSVRSLCAITQALHFATACLDGAQAGPGVIKALIDAGLMRDLSDFYTLTKVVVAPLAATYA
jgi:hypothetical protein